MFDQDMEQFAQLFIFVALVVSGLGASLLAFIYARARSDYRRSTYEREVVVRMWLEVSSKDGAERRGTESASSSSE